MAFHQNKQKYCCPYTSIYIYARLVFGDENNLKAFRLKAYQSCHGFVGSEFKQDYFIKEGLVRGSGFFSGCIEH